ncbi:hypothetical protein LINPERPRIM_LOCUS25206, partial [Linum perenne]
MARKSRANGERVGGFELKQRERVKERKAAVARPISGNREREVVAADAEGSQRKEVDVGWSCGGGDRLQEPWKSRR